MRSESKTHLWMDCEILLLKINQLQVEDRYDVTLEKLQKALPGFKVIKELCVFLKEHKLIEVDKCFIDEKSRISLSDRAILYIQYHDLSLLKLEEGK